VDGADGICQDAADNSGQPFLLGKTWKAWLSDSFEGPDTRLTQSSIPYARVDGVQVAADWADLIDGTIDAPIDVTETGGPADIFQAVWTNTVPSGAPDNFTANPAVDNCNDWTSGVGTGRTGLHSATNNSWTGNPGVQRDCAGPHGVYCLQQ
jgi:hypothetical protein